MSLHRKCSFFLYLSYDLHHCIEQSCRGISRVYPVLKRLRHEVVSEFRLALVFFYVTVECLHGMAFVWSHWRGFEPASYSLQGNRSTPELQWHGADRGSRTLPFMAWKARDATRALARFYFRTVLYPVELPLLSGLDSNQHRR